MTTLWIKFANPEDVYKIDPLWNYNGEDWPSDMLVCPLCGGLVHLPVNLPDDAILIKPYGDVYRPLPLEAPHIVVRSDPDLPSISGLFGDVTIYDVSKLYIKCQVCFPHMGEDSTDCE